MKKIVDRRGAPFRVLNGMLTADEYDIPKLLDNRTKFLTNFESAVDTAYDKVRVSTNRGTVRSVIFLLITKTALGVVAEVPVDFALSGMIIWEALLINILFPPLYMIVLRMTILMPDGANTAALTAETDRVFYNNQPILIPRAQHFAVGYRIVYTVVFLAVFGVVLWVLDMLHFNIVQIIIFFVFVSAASFLGFKLARTVREFELVASRQNFGTTVRDFLYMPFVVLGRWINEKYSKVPIVSNVLDVFIELPLKTILHTIRRWGSFISSKKDNL
jgi:hypothetical protein